MSRIDSEDVGAWIFCTVLMIVVVCFMIMLVVQTYRFVTDSEARLPEQRLDVDLEVIDG